jgi:hypothetical protein
MFPQEGSRGTPSAAAAGLRVNHILFFLAGRACKIKQMVSRCSFFFWEGGNDVELLKNS